MKNQIDELGDLLLESEGIGDDPKHKQHIADFKYRWRSADVHFQHAFFHAQKIGNDDATTLVPALDDLQEAFGMLEECCKEWREWLQGILPKEKF